jgi:hypothetical protein
MGGRAVEGTGLEKRPWSCRTAPLPPSSRLSGLVLEALAPCKSVSYRFIGGKIGGKKSHRWRRTFRRADFATSSWYSHRGFWARQRRQPRQGGRAALGRIPVPQN